MKELYIIGAGGFGREVADTVHRINDVEPTYDIKGFIDDDEELWGSTKDGLTILGGTDHLKKIGQGKEVYAVIAIASYRAKVAISSKLEGIVKWATIIDPSCSVSQYAEIGEGCIFQPNTFVSCDTKVGKHCVVNVHSTIGHDAIVEAFTSMMPYSDVNGNVHLEEGVYLGAAVCIIPSIHVGRETIIGAGAVVIRDLPGKCTAVGNPAKIIKQNQE